MSVIKKIFIILFITCYSFETNAEITSKQQLNIFFGQLQQSQNEYEGNILEEKIWTIWNKHPNDDFLTDKLEFATQLMYQGSFDYALQIFTNIIHKDPSWSEAWNKRATLLFLMNDFSQSLKDIDQVLKLEPRHFGALSGRAQIYIKQENYLQALNDLIKVNKIHPASHSKELIHKLEKLIKGLEI